LNMNAQLPEQHTSHLDSSLKSILLVEDDEATREVLADLIALETSNRVLAFESAEAVLQHLEEIKAAEPFLFIFDLQLPGMDALELNDRLRSLPEFACQHTIIITAVTMNLAKELAIDRRGLTLLRKPFNMEVLLGYIDQYAKEVVLDFGQLI
jgi:two-component system, response regulator YesN